MIAGIVVIVGVIFFLFFAGGRKIKRERIKKEVVVSLFKKVDACISGGRLIEARKVLESASEKTFDPAALSEIRKRMEEVNVKILFSPTIDEHSREYIVKGGDNLIKIAKQFNTTVGLIKRVNGLKSDIIKPKQKLKVITAKFSIVVDKSQNLLFLKQEDEIIKTYIVSTGKENSTPTGSFKITEDRIKNPTWFKTGAIIPPDSEENILGSRWLGLDIKGYGIHGTREPDSLGEQVTLGCIRMSNEDVEELFDIVPVGTEVVIVD